MHLAGQILSALTLHADPTRRAHSLEYAPTALHVLGVTMPDVNATTAEALRAFKPLPPDARWHLLHALLDLETFETSLVAFDLIARHRPTLEALTPAQARSLLRGLDNWVTVDTLGPRVLGPAWRLGRLDDAFAHDLATHADPFMRRLALTMTVALNLKSRGGHGDTPRTLAIAATAVTDRHDLVVKALSWALRQLAPWDPSAVRAFLEAHAPQLAPRVLREVRRKLETGKKNG